ncbi:MAG: sugar transferase [Phycisphaeraceae bacterium]
MTTATLKPRRTVCELPTVWGLTPVELHDRFWTARGVQVVRCGEPTEIIDNAELFLLTAPRLLVMFGLRRVVEELSWIKPDVLWIRVSDERDGGYREFAVTDEQDNLVSFERDYGSRDSRFSRVAVTSSPAIARAWQAAASPREGWQQLRERVSRRRRTSLVLGGRAFDRESPEEVMDFMHQLVTAWKQPTVTIERAQRHGSGIWHDPDSRIGDKVRFVGPMWVGAGRKLVAGVSAVGPAVLWDEPGSRPEVEHVRWEDLEPGEVFHMPLRQPLQSSLQRVFKRLFDIGFAGLALLLTLPLFPLIMLAIWREDGRPFFFSHRRETLGGREFGCIKFRTMRRDAEQIKAQIAASNEVDGPQFFIKDDPRITRVGKFLRDNQLDELPQLVNVLLGHMSIVGPRPSPFKENQYCPAWREARLSVRPGLTGLWQVMRTRRPGEDFQEWIRYDIEYVENVSFRLDIKIIWKTIILLIRGT